MKAITTFLVTTGAIVYAGLNHGFDAAMVAWLATPITMYAAFTLTKRH